jgi:hypothetical protein
MKTLQEQYNLIKEGKGDKAYFMKLARYNFPDLITPVLSYNDTITVLKNKSILSEGIGGLVTTGKKQDWHAIFNENIEKLKEKKDEEEDEDDEKYKEMIKRYEEEQDAKHTLSNIGNLKEAKEAKAEEKEPTKEVTDMETRGYDYKDTKNYDNVFGEEFLKGFYTEMQDPKNEGKTVEELRAIVAKNLAKDLSHYVKDGQFGIKGVGYTTEAPGLGTPKEAKGKHKSSGYGDLKESVLRSQIYLLVKEVLAEANTTEFEVGDTVTYKGDKYKITRFIDDRIYIKSLKQGGRPDSWVKASDLKEILRPEDKKEFDRITTFAEKLYDKTGSVSGALEALKQIDPKNYVRFENEADEIKFTGGQIWRVKRLGVDPVNGHISETQMDGYPVDQIFVNNTTIDDLEVLIKTRMSGYAKSE